MGHKRLHAERRASGPLRHESLLTAAPIHLLPVIIPNDLSHLTAMRTRELYQPMDGHDLRPRQLLGSVGRRDVLAPFVTTSAGRRTAARTRLPPQFQNPVLIATRSLERPCHDVMPFGGFKFGVI